MSRGFGFRFKPFLQKFPAVKKESFMAQMMRQPPPSLASYMQAIGSGGAKPDSQASAKPPEQPNRDAIQGMIQNEMQKFKMFQEKKASLQHELTMIEQNLLKIQGSLEVFQAMGFIKLN